MLKKFGEEICSGDICLLCVAKCPSCGSNDIVIRFSPIYESVKSSSNNEISIVLKDECIMVECSNCGGRFGKQTADQEKNPSIEPLKRSLLRYLNLPSDATVKSAPQTNGNHRTTVALVCPLD